MTGSLASAKLSDAQGGQCLPDLEDEEPGSEAAADSAINTRDAPHVCGAITVRLDRSLGKPCKGAVPAAQ